MSAELVITNLFIFALAGFLGLEVIRRIPKLLHTPLMALTNALSAIALVAAIVVLSEANSTGQKFLLFLAMIASTINIVGGFIITDKMLRMFKHRERPKPAAAAESEPSA